MLGVAIEDEPLSRTQYDRRATPPAVAAFQATPQGAGDEQMQDLTPCTTRPLSPPHPLILLHA